MVWNSNRCNATSTGRQIMSEDECPECGRAWYVWHNSEAVDIDDETCDQYTCCECGYTEFVAVGADVKWP